MELIKLLVISTIASIIPGQMIRVNFTEQGAFTITDILTVTTVLFFLIYSLAVKKSLKIPQRIFTPAMLFTFAAASSLYLSQSNFSLKEVAISSFFLLRFFFYFLMTVIIYNLVKKQQILNWIHTLLFIGTVFAIIGLVQIITISDLTFLASSGWDPHQKRIVTSLLDPNFSGFIFSLLAAFSTSLYLYKKNKIYIAQSVVFYLALILTFSRSSYLAAVFAIIVIGALKSPKLIAVSFVVFLISFMTIGQMRDRIIGAFTLDETSQARISSWQNALTIFKDYPAFGVGFNTYRYAQARYGFFPPGELGGHSGSGTDSSILLILATTGIFGAGFFLFLLASIALVLIKRARLSYLGLASLSAFIGLLIHSQFVNSLFFPQIMIIFWSILGLNLVDDI